MEGSRTVGEKGGASGVVIPTIPRPSFRGLVSRGGGKKKEKAWSPVVYKLCIIVLPGSSVGIATGYGLDGGGGEIYRISDRPWGPPSHLYSGNRVFPGD
jgi:hypothetical protein